MKTKTLVKTFDQYLLRVAFIFSALLNALVWYIEEANYSFRFISSMELFPFVLSTALTAGLIIGAYYCLKSFRLEPRLQLAAACLIGGLPILALIFWIINA